MKERWIADWPPSDRWPHYTRSNAGEVLATPASPLGQQFTFDNGIALGWRDGYVRQGYFNEGEMSETFPEPCGFFGGYFYINLSNVRMQGARSPVVTVEQLDTAFFGDHPDVPPYVADPRDDRPDLVPKILEHLGWVMSTHVWPEIDEQKAEMKALRRNRPDLTTMSDAEIVARARTLQPWLVALFNTHTVSSSSSGIAPGMLFVVGQAIGDPTVPMKLISGIGDVDSAEPSYALWEISRLVRNSPELTTAFDAGIDGLLERLRGSDSADAKTFLSTIDEFLVEFGSRGPNEWEISAPSWETNPQLPLAMIERIRTQSDEESPRNRNATKAAERLAVIEEVRAKLVPLGEELAGMFEGALVAGNMQAFRERTKSTIVIPVNELRVMFNELGRRHHEAGHIADPQYIFMLLDEELEAFVASPTGWNDKLAERHAMWRELFDLEPPYFIRDAVVPPLTDWVRRTKPDVQSAEVGDVLHGVAGCPGIVRGRACVILDPADPRDLEPDDILIAPQTDPGWTPLFMTAGGVVVNVGGQISHAIIVSRELGLPCVVSVTNATARIPNGALIEVDGDSGTVTILELPDLMSGLASFNPFDAETLQCPYPLYARMREEAPVLHLAELRMYLVTRHDLVLGILRDPATYSSRFGRPTMPLSGEHAERVNAAIAEGYPRVPTMLTADPPEHTRFRGLVAKAFNARTIASMEPFIRQIVGELIDAWGDRTEIEFVTEFAVPLPVHVIATMLSQPAERFDDIKRWSDASIAGIGTNLSVNARIAAERETNEFQRHFEREIEDRRAHPRDDLISNLVHATIDEPGVDPRPLELPEMISIISQLMVAGNETTTKLLSEMMRLLGEHADQWQAVRADPTRIERIVEEALRLSSPTQGIFRIATADVELGGIAIPAGSRIVLVYGAANRDESLFADPESFDPDRERLKEHLAFGRGIHFCLGAALSRLEARVALEELSRRVACYRLAESNDFRYIPSFMLRGLQRLDLDQIEMAPDHSIL